MTNSLPSGTVTFLFTDIEGSTKLAQQHPDAIPVLLARHNQILHQAIEGQNGYVFQVVGDSFAAAFHFASDALNAAVDAQRKLYNEAWTPALIKVRMGIHTGAAQLQINSNDNTYSGYGTLASTQRIMSAGHGGQILISGATRELVRDALPADTELADLGEKRLKDLLRPEHLYQLNALGLPSIFPPLKTLDSFPNNLPMQLTTFVGREKEITELKQELDAHRLVTLTGSGGTGKTRLSLQVAAELLDHFDHGVWFVELAPLADPELIPQIILSAIGVNEQPGKTPLELLKEYLHERKTLIVLDNCEHLIEASARVTNTLLNGAPGVKILASSREALGVKGELSYPVPSLSLPDPKHLPAIEQLSQYEAVRLFIDRALLVAPHFIVDKDNAPFIAQICYRLDGIPLAIELAAARIKMMSIEQISQRLDDRFRLLTGGARTSLPRQQTLRALIDWSYDLLSEKERLLLRRFSVFARSWTLEAAEAVCAGDGIDTYDVLDLLTQLVNKSLVAVIEQSQSGETRYRMLETVRQYAREKLLEAGESEIIRQQHLNYFVKLVKQAEPELYRSNQMRWLNRLDDELDNLRMALEWALAADVEAGLRISAIPWRFWQRGYLREIGDRLAQLLERHNTVDSLHVQALLISAYCNFFQGNFPEALTIAGQALQLARTLSDRQIEAFSLSVLGIFTLMIESAAGIPLLEQGLDIYRALGNKIGQAEALYWLSINNNDMDRAIEVSRESLSLFRELGHLSGIAGSLTELARRTIWMGDVSLPAPWLEEALSISRQLGDQTREAEILIAFGHLAYWQGDYRRANAYFEEAILLSEKIGEHYQNLWAHVHMAYAVLQQGDIQRAREMFEDNIRSTQKAGSMIAIVNTVEGVASLYVNQEQPERAARLFAWADMMREKTDIHRHPVEWASVERDLEVIHTKLNDSDFARLSAEGQSLTVDEALALALEE
jgi:predicted ATPase/class 3 adenylate cyclase/Tfp pilus assembly protein PilF